MVTINKKREELFEYYHKNIEKNFKIAYHGSPRARWMYANYKGDRYYNNIEYNHRTIFPNEIVIDFDKTPARNKKNSEEVVERLKKEGLAFSYWDTGIGKGYHVHIFFELPPLCLEDRLTYKQLLLRHLCWGLLNEVDSQLCGKHLIRAEYGLYEKKITSFVYKKLIFQTNFKVNKLPEIVKERFIKKKEEMKNIKIPKRDLQDKPCINFLEHEDFRGVNDGTKRAMFILVSHYKSKLNEDELFAKIRTWCNYYLKANIPDYKIRYLIQREMKGQGKGKYVGCRFVQQLLEEFNRKSLCKRCIK